jgi:S1-C subfamily serine protease
VKRLDLSLVVLLLVLVLFGGAIAQMARAYPDAGRGLVIYAREQKDLFIDAGLVQESYRVRASSSLAQQLRAQTVIVATETSAHSAYMGAGVIVASRNGMLTILTAKHIIAHKGEHFVVFPNRRGRVAARIVPSHDADLALVYVREVPGLSYSIAKLGDKSFRSGETFVVMGHPGAKSWTASPGVAEEHLRETLLFCPTCDRGDSGAGAFDKHGTLRGIVVTKAIMSTPSYKSWRYISLTAFEVERPEAIRAFLRTAKS